MGGVCPREEGESEKTQIVRVNDLCYNHLDVSEGSCILTFPSLHGFGCFRVIVYSRCDLKRANRRALDAGIQMSSTGQQELETLSVVLSNFGGTFLGLLW